MSILFATRGLDPDDWIARIKGQRPDLPVVRPGEAFDPAAVRYALVHGPEPGSLAGLPNLEVVFSLAAGVDRLLADPALPDVPLVRSRSTGLRDRMSEWVVLHVLMHHRQVRMYDYQQYEKIWADDPQQPAARDVRIGVLGLGTIGGDAAQKLAALGFDVAGYSRTPRMLPGIACFAGAERDAFLARTDILVCLLPLTDATRGCLSRDLFAKLARDGRLGSPVLLNAGRGGLQVEADIVSCLDDGTLKAATLDVFETEPLPEDSPLWHHPRVTVTPHNAGLTAPDDILDPILAAIAAFERGEPLRDVVDRQRQY